MASGKYKQLVSNTLLFAISNFSSKLLSFLDCIDCNVTSSGNCNCHSLDVFSVDL